MKGATADLRLPSSYSNSSSAIDLESLHQVVVKAVGNWKEATTALLPIHILRYDSLGTALVHLV